MIAYLRRIWAELGRNIFVGERYEKNVLGIKLVSVLIIVVNIITGYQNLKSGYYEAVVSGLALIVAGLLMLYFTAVRKNRRMAVIVAIIAIIVSYSYDAITVTNVVAIFWTLLFPWAFCYFAGVKEGIVLSLYFTVLYAILFYTPLGQFMQGKYPEIIVQRIPLIYLANTFLCVYIMVQYHKSTLHQMDYAEQLLEAKEAADKANAAKSDFLANMSHEIRTPINAVLGMNEMVLQESLQVRNLAPKDRTDIRDALTDICGYSENIESAGSNLLSIINDILDFSKIESGRMDLTEADYQLSTVLNDVRSMFAFKARDKGLDFRMDVDRALPDGLYGDEVRVRQILTNILGNAVKYTNKGSVTFSVRKEAGAEIRVGGMLPLLITVRDTGIGIRAEDVGRLFTKFERIDLQRNSTIEGSGLGLAITRNLLDIMGGTIDVQSVYGEGSVFTVVLPQKVVSAEPIGDLREKYEHSMRETRPYPESFRAPEARVLIVDDTRMNLAVAAGLLKKTGLMIDTAGSGPEAIALARTIRYDLILMDQRMPEMNGTEAMRCIRADADGMNRDTPFICLTADAVNGARSRYLAEGFSDYLAKPIDSTALEEMMMKHLPAEKVTAVSEGGREAEDTQPDECAPDQYAPLREAGVDPAVGLGYCQRDEALYHSLLAEYARGAETRTRDLEQYLQARDWDAFAIQVHAVKSTSKMIGAADLAERAASLEQAANEGDRAAIEAGYPRFMAGYEAVAAAIRVMGPSAEPLAEDDEILEFLPE